jgi:predicted DCC family thiol-disulfide oxidoreductase YuxK
MIEKLLMKPLSDHIIFYDADCPLCKAYTGAFIKNNMLDRNGRMPYGSMHSDIQAAIDMDRARNEIALMNTKTGQITYGIDSLFAIIGNAAPVSRPLFRNRIFRWCMVRLYKFISYNRKIIAAVKPTGTISCTPDFNLTYRLTYLLLTVLVTGMVLHHYNRLLIYVMPAGSAWREYAVCAGQLVFQGIVLLLLCKEKLMDYLGNMMTVSLIGSLLLLPALLVHKLLPAMPAAFYPAWFLVVVAIMLAEHMRRVKLLGLYLLPSATWVLYRVLVLALILTM